MENICLGRYFVYPYRFLNIIGRKKVDALRLKGSNCLFKTMPVRIGFYYTHNLFIREIDQLGDVRFNCVMIYKDMGHHFTYTAKLSLFFLILFPNNNTLIYAPLFSSFLKITVFDKGT